MTPQSSRAVPRVPGLTRPRALLLARCSAPPGGCGFCGGTWCPGNPVARVRQRVRADGHPTSSRQTKPRGPVGTQARAVVSLSCPISVHGKSGLSHRKVPCFKEFADGREWDTAMLLLFPHLPLARSKPEHVPGFPARVLSPL